MNEKQQPTSLADERTTAFGNTISTLTALFIPDIEDDEWTWWPAGHNFYEEWAEGTLAQLALDSACQVMAGDFVQEAVEQAVEIARYGLAIMKECAGEEPYLPFRLLLYSLENGVLQEFEETASVLAGCFEIGAMLSQERPDQRHDIIAEELYGAASDWAIPLAFGLIGLKLHLLGPAFWMAMQDWYEQLLARAQAHYLRDAQVAS